MAPALIERLAPATLPADAGRAGEALAELWRRTDDESPVARLKALADESAKTQVLLSSIFSASPYLAGLIGRMPGTAAGLLAKPPEQSLDSVLADLAALVPAVGDCPGEDEIMTDLRRLKARAALLIAFADLGGVWDLDQVTGALSAVADAVLGAAVAWLYRDGAAQGVFSDAGAPPGGPGCGFVVLALGKHGARELNFSSDLDLIVFYDPESAPLAEGAEPATVFVRLTRTLVRLLQERTGDGYVYRLDLRLRPDPGATSVAMAVEAAAQYYENLGQNWERAAMIKARPVAGDIPLGAAFLERLIPFIWRKYLDYAAIADVHSIKRQIHAFKGHAEAGALGHNIKIGRGGIREIEFFVQTQQLIAGGRAPELRGSRTVEMLHALAAGEWITPDAAADLERAYGFLRTVEHRLQMINDEQTQLLPGTEDAYAAFARFAGFETADAFTATLMRTLACVEEHYSALFESAPSLGDESGSLVFTGGEDDPDTIETLSRMGFAAPAQVSAAVRGWHFGRYAANRSARSRELLTELMPILLRALAETAQPDRAFIAFDSFLAGLPAGVQVFSLLRANPKLLDLLATIMGTAPRLAELLAKHPRMLDVVLEADFFAPLPGRDAFGALLAEAFQRANGLEETLDRARIIGHEQSFRIGVRILTGTTDARAAGHAFTALAEAEIVALLEAAGAELAAAHGRVPGGRAAVVAMGKLGGMEMTAGSDLDLMLVYDFDDGATASNGARPLAPSQYFSRLTQRLISALSAPTAEGTLYEVDMRLRPSGNQGPIATHISSFVDYHGRSAWTWEKLALTRARTIAGDGALCERVSSIIRTALCAPRDEAAMARDVAGMRARIAREKKAGGLWDIKLARGGLIDLEFICQYLQLVHAARHPDVLDPNTGRALEKLRAAGALDETAASDLLEAARFLHTLTQVLRLCVEGRFEPVAAPSELKMLLARAVDLPDFPRVEAQLAETESRVKMIYEQLIEGKN